MKIVLFLLLLTTPLFAKSTVCLNMIVKNETPVIKRCLTSVKPLIDYWVIVDTGSTDGTQEMIKEFMKDIPGELHERPWKNFGHNRNEALQLAKDKADYLLFIDADEMYTYPENYKFPELSKDFYHINTSFGGTQYARVELIKNSLDWTWKGVLHEYLEAPNAQTSELLPLITNVVNTDGARSQDPLKYQKDAEILEAALQEDSYNKRDRFYLAQSYRDAGQPELAIKNYQARIDLGGWDQEQFWSMLQIAKMQEQLEKPEHEVINSYLKAYLYRPARAEPLYYLANYYRKKENFFMGLLVAKQGLSIPLSDDILFVEKWIYDWGLLLEYSVSAYWLGRYDEAQVISNLLLAKKDLPEHVRECVLNNLRWIALKTSMSRQVYHRDTEDTEGARDGERL